MLRVLALLALAGAMLPSGAASPPEYCADPGPLPNLGPGTCASSPAYCNGAVQCPSLGLKPCEECPEPLGYRAECAGYGFVRDGRVHVCTVHTPYGSIAEEGVPLP